MDGGLAFADHNGNLTGGEAGGEAQRQQLGPFVGGQAAQRQFTANSSFLVQHGGFQVGVGRRLRLNRQGVPGQGGPALATIGVGRQVVGDADANQAANGTPRAW